MHTAEPVAVVQVVRLVWEAEHRDARSATARRAGPLCDEGPPWYEQWSVNVAWVDRDRLTPDLFAGVPDRSREELVSLYGGGTVAGQAGAVGSPSSATTSS